MTTPSTIISDKIYVCPDCGSPAVTASALAGGAGECRRCPWKGQVEDLLVVPIEHTLGSPDELKSTFHREMKTLFAKTFGIRLLQFLVRWGFVGAPPPLSSPPARMKPYTQLVGRYVEAAARGAANAILETREAIELERRSGGREIPRA